MGEKHLDGLVSVSLVTWNSLPNAKECLASLFRQRYHNFEVLLVDNASSDGTSEQVRRIYPHVMVIDNTRNEGFAKAHNQNISRSHGEYVLILNPDVILAYDFLEILITTAIKNPKAGAFSGLLLREKSKIIDSAGIGFSPWKRVFDDRRKLPVQNEPIFGPSGAAALYRRAMLQDICEGDEFFDEMFFAYYEDVDLSWRAQSRGWSAQLVPEAKAWHVRKAAKGLGALHAQPYIFRNRYWTLLKNERARDFWFHFPLAFAFESLRWVRWLFTNPFVFTQLQTMIHSLPEMWKKRRNLHYRRTVLNFSPNKFLLK